MKVQITIYCDEDKHQWLMEMLFEYYEQLCNRVERRIVDHKIGLPWVKNPRPDIGLEEFDWEPSEGFEIDYSEDYTDEPGGKSKLVSAISRGASFTLRDVLFDKFYDDIPA